MLLTEATPIGPEETAGELSARLAAIGARLLERTLDGIGTLPRIPQDHAKATLAPRLKKEDGWLRPAEPARDLVNRVRGCNPWPGAALITPAGRLLVWRAIALDAPGLTSPPGALIPSPLPLSPQGRGQGEGPLAIATGDGLLLPLEVQPENRKAMAWADFLRGARLAPGARVSEPEP